MTAPWGIEFKEDVILVFDDHILVIMRDNDLDGPFLLLRNGLRLDAGLDLAVNEVLDEFADFVVCDLAFLAEGEFGVLDCVLDGKGGPFSILKIQVASVCAEGFGIDCSEIDRSLVLLGEGLQCRCEFCALFGCFGEDVGEGDLGLEGALSAIGSPKIARAKRKPTAI